MANPQALGSLQGIGPAEDAFALTPHATNDMPANKGFSVNGAGDVTIRSVRSSADVVISVQAGVIYPVAIKKLRVAGTTATGIVGYN